ncbi:MAG: VCBS repeat-containing protein [Planctomycetaceae bacterium]
MKISRLLELFRVTDKRGRRRRSMLAETLEARQLLTLGPFQQVNYFMPTVLPETDENTSFQLVDWDNNGYHDVIEIAHGGTKSGLVEVRAYPGNYDNYDAKAGGASESSIINTTVPINAVDASEWQFLSDYWNAGSHPDLVAIHKSNTSSGFVEIIVATGASLYQTLQGPFVTSLTAIGANWAFDGGHFDGDGRLDLLAIRRDGNAGTEITVLSGVASGNNRFDSTLFQGTTALPRTNNMFDFIVGDFDLDGVAELLALQTVGTESNRIEAHVLPELQVPTTRRRSAGSNPVPQLGAYQMGPYTVLTPSR